MKVRIRKKDEDNIVLEQEREAKKEGVAPGWKIIGYFGKLEDMLDALIRLMLDTPQGDTLEEQLADLQKQIEVKTEKMRRQLIALQTEIEFLMWSHTYAWSMPE